MEQNKCLVNSLPESHQDIDPEDSKMCPYLTSIKNKKDKKPEEEKLQGGCPVMTIDPNKKSPALESMPELFDIPYESSYDDIFKKNNKFV